MSVTRVGLLLTVAQPLLVDATESRQNPIRKVVKLLQGLQKKCEAEGEKAEELYKKFMCYCQNSGGDLTASIEAATAKIPELASSIEAGKSRKTQLESDLKSHKADRRTAKDAIAEATSIREKEKAVFDKDHADLTANLAATRKATAAIAKGMEGAFLQTSAADVLRNLVNSREGMTDSDRRDVLAFLAGGQQGEYAPASGEIVGVLKQMADTMAADDKDLVAKESGAVKDFDALIRSKEKEVSILTKSIETKTARVGELGVDIATMEADAGDTAEALEEDKKFGKDLKKNCAEKTGIHEGEKKLRAQEVVALADTIKILNDDDALDLFKKTLPSAGSSFLQVQRTSASVRAEARSIVATARDQAKSGRHHLDFILLALRGRKAGFDKILKLIDEMVVVMKKEQGDDDDKKDYCEQQLDQVEDQKKVLDQKIADLATVLSDTKEGISKLTEEIAGLKAGIIALDSQVEEATAQRKVEAAEHKELMQSDTAAKELILFAKNRLNKFYNPSQHKAASLGQLSEGDDTGISAFVQTAMHREAPPPPPATAAAYTKKAEGSSGVLAMMDLLVQDLDKEMTTAEVEEKNAQKEYEETITDAAEKRRLDSKSVTDKEGAKAELEGTLERSKGEKKAGTKELMGVDKALFSLHGECDWLLQNYGARKQARSDEIDALGKAKAVLSGADYSLLEVSRTHRLLARSHSQTCPSSSIQCGMQKDAAGATVFVPHDMPTPGKCVSIGSKVPADGQIKMCGPGKWTISRMSCDKHDYKKVEIVQPTNAYTASDCKVYNLKDYYQIHGYIGSGIFTCDATAR